MSSNELENDDINDSSEQHENGTDSHNLSTTNLSIQSSNELESHGNNISSEQHTPEGQTDSDGYEYHYTSATNPEVHGNNLLGNVIKGSDSNDLLYGGDVNDVLDGGNGNDTLEGGSGNDTLIGGSNTDKGDNNLNGGNGDDILVGGGSKTREFDQFLASHQDIVNTIKTDQKWDSMASTVISATDNSGGGVHNVFDIHSNSGHDQIFNFHAATDKIQLDLGLNASDILDIDSLTHHIQISGNDLSIDLGGGNTVTLVGVDIAGLTANNVIFA